MRHGRSFDSMIVLWYSFVKKVSALHGVGSSGCRAIELPAEDTAGKAYELILPCSAEAEDLRC